MSEETMLTIEDLPDEYEVAVVVLTTTRGVDAGDAGDRAVIALNRLLRSPTRIPLPHRGGVVEGATVEVHGVVEIGWALRGGYVTATATPLARRERQP